MGCCVYALWHLPGCGAASGTGPSAVCLAWRFPARCVEARPEGATGGRWGRPPGTINILYKFCPGRRRRVTPQNRFLIGFSV